MENFQKLRRKSLRRHLRRFHPSRLRFRRLFPVSLNPAPQVPDIIGAVVAAQALLPDVGKITTRHLEYAADLQRSLPKALESATRDPLGASALIYALLLSNEPAAREKQLASLATETSDPIVDETLNQSGPKLKT